MEKAQGGDVGGASVNNASTVIRVLRRKGSFRWGYNAGGTEGVGGNLQTGLMEGKMDGWKEKKQ